MLERILLLIAALLGMLILITITLDYLPIQNPKRLEGSKGFIVSKILSRCYSCFSNNFPSKRSVICYRFSFKSEEVIKSEDLQKALDESKLTRKRLKAEDLGKEGEIVIRYENGIIFVEKI